MELERIAPEPLSKRPDGAVEASLAIQSVARSRVERAKLRESRAAERDLDVSLAAVAVSQLVPVGETFAFSKLSAAELSLTSLSALGRYPHLTSLQLSHNKLRSLAPLACLCSLRTLAATNNLLTSFDLAVAAATATTPTGRGLTFADLRCNALQHTGLLGEHTELTELRLDANCLSSLAGLSPLRQLRKLSVSRNRLTDVSDLHDAAPHL